MAQEKTSELTIYYQDDVYSWQAICRQMSGLSHSQYFQADKVTVPAENRFLTTLFLLWGWNEQWRIFPLSADYSALDEKIFFGDPDPQRKNVALAITTSGSQADPKVALISRTNIISHCESFVRIIPLNSKTIWLNCMPMSHIAGVMIVYRCWFNNAAMLLHDEFNARQVWQDLHRYHVTHISLVPRMLARLLDHCRGASPPKYLSHVIVGGDKLPESLYQRAQSTGWPVYVSYGMTEATSTIAIGRSPEKLKILDGFDVKVSPEGVLKIKASMVISAYADSSVNSSIESEWLATNDQVELDKRYLKIIGRSDHMIISGGKNIAPEYIEELLSSSPGIDDIAIGKYIPSDGGDAWGNTIIALVCGDIKQLKQWLEGHVKPCFQPKIFVAAKTIPRNALGKIDRKKLQLILDKNLPEQA